MQGVDRRHKTPNKRINIAEIRRMQESSWNCGIVALSDSHRVADNPNPLAAIMPRKATRPIAPRWARLCHSGTMVSMPFRPGICNLGHLEGDATPNDDPFI
jgi:hypothetical protein